MKNLDALYKVIGAKESDSIDSILDKIAPFFSDALNESMPPKQKGCRWDLRYFNDGDTIRITKKHGDDDLGHIQFDTDFDSFHNSDPNDADLRKIMQVMVLGLLSS
jgi:hypothetical protein